MKNVYSSKAKACKAAERLADQHGKAWVYVTPIVSGINAGKFCVTPDKLSDRSQELEFIPEGTAIQPGTGGMLVKAGSIL